MDFAEAMEARPMDHLESRVAYLERRIATLDADTPRERPFPNTRSF